MARTLFYIECFPLRNDVIHFSGVVRSFFGPLINKWSEEDPGEFILLCNHAIYREICIKMPSLIPYVITTTLEEEFELMSLIRSWADDGMNLWIDVINGVEKREYSIFNSILDRVKKLYEFDTLAMWGMNQIISNYCSYNKIKTLHFELAPFRSPFPRSFYIDPIGTSSKHSATKISLEEIRGLKNEFIPIEVLLNLHSNDPTSFSSPFDGMLNYNKHKTSNLKSKIQLLIPLQIYDDINLKISSPFDSMFDFATFVLENFESSKYILIFKPHPGAFTRCGAPLKDHIRTEALVRKYENTIWHENDVSEKEYLSFLSNFDGIVTVNSSVGFEGALIGIPVLTLGKSMVKPINLIETPDEFKHSYSHQYKELIEDQNDIASFLFLTTFLKIDSAQKDLFLINKRINLIKNFNKSKPIDFYKSVASQIPYQTWI